MWEFGIVATEQQQQGQVLGLSGNGDVENGFPHVGVGRLVTPSVQFECEFE